ncbi:hypothetical protein [Faecalibaculum rodentium]|uniref:hypothetical protein n=1 Tax=Faecalibaculum rodentium TaxID=1702221 RepID=UPI00272C146C|nr:hypothetical protein [Faecalibaculum rodentium]
MEPKGLLNRLLECAFMFLLSIVLIRAGINILIEIWPVLLIIAVILLAVIIGWRIWKFIRSGMGKW